MAGDIKMLTNLWLSDFSYNRITELLISLIFLQHQLIAKMDYGTPLNVTDLRKKLLLSSMKSACLNGRHAEIMTSLKINSLMDVSLHGCNQGKRLRGYEGRALTHQKKQLTHLQSRSDDH